MTAESDAAKARSYLLGRRSEEEHSALEREYFRDDDVLDRIAAAEDELIEDYLANRLTDEERALFEREYLASARHRRRLRTVRQLLSAANKAGRTTTAPVRSAPGARRTVRMHWMAAAAAALVLLAVGTLWVFSVSRDDGPPAGNPTASTPGTPVPTPAAPVRPPPAEPARRVFAVSVSPVAVRSRTDDALVRIPNDVDVVALYLLSGGDDSKPPRARAIVRRVGGGEVWQGPAAIDANLPAGAIARLEVPAALLTPDDYVVTLNDVDAAGAEQERSRYFLRVRTR